MRSSSLLVFASILASSLAADAAPSLGAHPALPAAGPVHAAAAPRGVHRGPAVGPKTSHLEKTLRFESDTKMGQFVRSKFEPLTALFDGVRKGALTFSRPNPEAGRRREVDDSGYADVTGPLADVRAKQAALNAQFAAGPGRLPPSSSERGAASFAHVREGQAMRRAVFEPLGTTWLEADEIAGKGGTQVYVRKSHAVVAPEHLYDYRVRTVEKILQRAKWDASYRATLNATLRDPCTLVRLLHEGIGREYNARARPGHESSDPKTRARIAVTNDLRIVLRQLNAPALQPDAIPFSPGFEEGDIAEAVAELQAPKRARTR
jgi:hypothetical protein